MDYRINRKTGDKISVIGLGTSYIGSAAERDAVEALTFACEQGVNYTDLATAGAKTFRYYGTAFAGARQKMLYQVHFGANYENGTYGWSTDPEVIKRSVDAQLKALRTDYIDACVILGTS